MCHHNCTKCLSKVPVLVCGFMIVINLRVSAHQRAFSDSFLKSIRRECILHIFFKKTFCMLIEMWMNTGKGEIKRYEIQVLFIFVTLWWYIHVHITYIIHTLTHNSSFSISSFFAIHSISILCFPSIILFVICLFWYSLFLYFSLSLSLTLMSILRFFDSFICLFSCAAISSRSLSLSSLRTDVWSYSRETFFRLDVTKKVFIHKEVENVAPGVFGCSYFGSRRTKSHTHPSKEGRWRWTFCRACISRKKGAIYIFTFHRSAFRTQRRP